MHGNFFRQIQGKINGIFHPMEDSNETFQFNEKHFQFLQEQDKG